MAKASDLVGGDFEKSSIEVTVNNEQGDLFTSPDMVDGEFRVLECYGGGSPTHADYFKMSYQRVWNTIYWKILEGAITGANAGSSTALLTTVVDGVSAGDAAVPTVDIRDAKLTVPGPGNWIVPDGVTSICVVCVGAGGGGNPTTGASNDVGGGGGGLGWKNNIAVTPGQSIPYTVGAPGDWGLDGSDTTILGITANGGGGSTTAITGAGGGFTGATGGGNGGNGADIHSRPGGAGGAAGYSGNGGNGVRGNNNTHDTQHQGTGGGAAGGRGGQSSENSFRGGGVNLYGEGASGDQLLGDLTGENGSFDFLNGHNEGYGAGGPSNAGTTVGHNDPERGGAIRILWGAGRSFPNNAAVVLATDIEAFSPKLYIRGENESGGNDTRIISLYHREIIKD